MGSLFDDVIDTTFGHPEEAAATAAPIRKPQGGSAQSAGGAAPAGSATPLTAEDAETSALRPDDPADNLSEAPMETSVAGDGVSGTSSTGAARGAGEAESGEATEATSPRAPRNVPMEFGDGQVSQVKGVPVQLLEELRSLARNQLKPIERVWLDKISISKLVTAFIAVKLGVRPADSGADEHTMRLMQLFGELDPAGEALEQRIEALSVQVRRQRKEQQADRVRARAVERGVALLVGERLEPSRDLLELSPGSVDRPNHDRAEKLLREAATHLVQVDTNADGRRMS